VAAVRFLRAYDEGLGDLREAFDDVVDVGAAHGAGCAGTPRNRRCRAARRTFGNCTTVAGDPKFVVLRAVKR
ncbi:hypothetical protein ACWD6U_39500, partial [Streptomyces sp. NPDC005149]